MPWVSAVAQLLLRHHVHLLTMPRLRRHSHELGSNRLRRQSILSHAVYAILYRPVCVPSCKQSRSSRSAGERRVMGAVGGVENILVVE